MSLSPGTYVITLTVRDGRGGSSSDTLLVTVVDAAPPAIHPRSPFPRCCLRSPPQLVAVTVGMSVSDACDGSVRCHITSVASSDPVDGADWVITGDLTLNLRAERSNKRIGRIYTVTIVCTDAAGNSSTKAVTVTVPRN